MVNIECAETYSVTFKRKKGTWNKLYFWAIFRGFNLRDEENQQKSAKTLDSPLFSALGEASSISSFFFYNLSKSPMHSSRLPSLSHGNLEKCNRMELGGVPQKMDGSS